MQQYPSRILAFFMLQLYARNPKIGYLFGFAPSYVGQALGEQPVATKIKLAIISTENSFLIMTVNFFLFIKLTVNH
jgi:hypothetical protein